MVYSLIGSFYGLSSLRRNYVFYKQIYNSRNSMGLVAQREFEKFTESTIVEILWA